MSYKKALKFKNYLNKTGIPIAFQAIFAEILTKNIPKEKALSYCSMRLRQIGNDLMQIVI